MNTESLPVRRNNNATNLLDEGKEPPKCCYQMYKKFIQAHGQFCLCDKFVASYLMPGLCIYWDHAFPVQPALQLQLVRKSAHLPAATDYLSHCCQCTTAATKYLAIHYQCHGLLLAPTSLGDFCFLLAKMTKKSGYGRATRDAHHDQSKVTIQ